MDDQKPDTAAKTKPEVKKPEAEKPEVNLEAKAVEMAEATKPEVLETEKVAGPKNMETEVEAAQDKIAEPTDTGVAMLAAAVAQLRKEHADHGSGNNTPLSKAITFVATAIDLIKAM